MYSLKYIKAVAFLLVKCFRSRVVDAETGEILGRYSARTPQNAGKTGRKLWKKYRPMYESRHKFGEEERRTYDGQGRLYRGFTDEGIPQVDFIDYAFEYVVEQESNREIVNRQIMEMRYTPRNKKVHYGLPNGLTKSERAIMENIMVTEHIRLKDRMIIHKNGRTMKTKAIAELVGVSERVAQKALKGLVDKDILERISGGGFIISKMFVFQIG